MKRFRTQGWKAGVAALFCALLAGCSPVWLLNLAVPRAGYHVVRDIAYGPGQDQNPSRRLDLYVPDGLKAGAPVLLFFYGGSWDSGSKDLYLAFGQAFTSQGIIVAVADYRVFPETRYPGFVEDGAEALVWLRGHAAQYGGDEKRIFVSGHSAGAYNAMMLAADGQYLRRAGGNISDICGVIGIAGPYDFLPLTDPKLIEIFGGANRAQTQPITYIDGKRPPMLLAYDPDDTTVLARNSLNLAQKLRDFGSAATLRAYPGAGHIGLILSLAPEFRFRTSLRADMGEFIQNTACTS